MLKTSDGRYYNWKYGRVFYTRSGSGAPLLLIHDTDPSFCSEEWTQIRKSLETQYTVFCIDLPGCGRSDKPALTYTNYMMADFLNRFIQEEIKEPVHLMASGYSSSFAATAALLKPDLYQGISMINPPLLKTLSSVPDQNSRILRTILQLPVLGASVYHMIYSHRQVEFQMTEKKFFNPFRISRHLIDTCYEASHSDQGKGRFLLSSLEGKYLNWNIRRPLMLLQVPVTVYYGTKVEKGEQTAQGYINLNPLFRSVPVPGVKYYPHLENPEEFLTLLSLTSI